MLTLAKKMIRHPGLVVALASVFGLLFMGRISSQEEKTAKPPQAGKVSPAKSDSAGKKNYLLKSPPKNFSPPKVNLINPDFDWGTVLQGEMVIHDFEIRNSGGSPLKIEKVVPVCGCTTVEFTKVIAPGATGKIKLKVDTKKFHGRIEKGAGIHTNASKAEQKITIAGNIEPVVIVEPKLPSITVVRGVPMKPLTVTLKKASKNPFKLNKVSCETGIVTLEKKEIEAGGHYEMMVTPNVPADGRKYHYAEIDANITVKDKTFGLPVRVSITVKERIEASPPSLYFSRRETEKLDKPGTPPLTKELKIKSLDSAHSFNITGVRLQGKHFKASLSTVIPGKEYKLTVELAKKPKAGTRRIVEKILVDTDDPTLKEITINATASLGSALSGGKRTTNFGPVSPPGAVKPTGSSK